MTMQYENMKIKALPAGTVVDNFIQGIGSYHYSDYLLEIVNETPFFLGKSKGEVYISPSSEAHGECDCISQHYQMDFKLIASKSELQARSIFSPQIYYDNGEAIYCASRIDSQSKNYHPIKATRIFAAAAITISKRFAAHSVNKNLTVVKLLRHLPADENH